MKSRKSLIRAILFVVRLQKSVAGHHGTALRRRNSNKRPKTPNSCGHSPLKRCDSTRIRGKVGQPKLLAQHRNSAPTTMFRASTPQIEIVIEPDGHHFASFSHMVPPYSLRLERQNSGGKMQIYVRPTISHHIAARIMLQRQPSLDDRITWATRTPNETNKTVRRQGSVEGTGSKLKHQPDEIQLVRKLKVNMINLLGALNAVETNDVDTLRLILSKNCVSINGFLDSGLYNQFRIRLTLLDVALMLNRPHVATLLLQHGATENISLSQPSRRRKVVDEALYDNESRLNALREKQQLSKDEEKKLKTFELHTTSLKKMKNVLEQEEFPGPPTDVKVSVASSSRVIVEFNPQLNPRAVIVKHKIEWSLSPNFETIAGSLVVRDMRETSANVDNLDHGQCYSFRICSGSMWGYGEFVAASPKIIRISSWEDVEGCENNREKHMKEIAELHCQVERHRQSAVWQKIFPNCSEIGIKKKKMGLRNLFSASSKFVKHAQRGIFLTTVIYTEDKVLCTVDDLLPTLLVDENTSNISADDMNWLLKLSLCWDQVAYLQDTVGGTWSNNSQLRVKILDAVASMHNALGVKDIGRIHHVPLCHSSGTVFLVSVHFVSENQAVQGLAMRWMRISKLMRKKSSSPSFDFLSKEIVNVLNFFESAQIPLERGLYLGYMRLQSGLNTIKVTVPDNLPSVLPFVSVRPNPHVSREEWEWLRIVEKDSSTRPNSAQYTFHMQMSRALNTLLHDLELDNDLIQSHRLYRFQVLQLHSDVSFILVLPKAEEVCLVNAGLSTTVDESVEHCKGCTSIPIPVFDMINLSTYQPDFIATYCRLSIFLEHFTMLINYEKRQCLLEDDRRVYAEQLDRLTDFQQRLDEVWRNARWISNIASIARDKQSDCGISLSRILMPPMTSPLNDDCADVGYHSDQSSEKFITFDAISTASVELNSKDPSPNASIRKILNRSQSVVDNDLNIENIDRLFLDDNLSISSNIENGSVAATKTVNHAPSPLSFLDAGSNLNSSQTIKSGILRVFPAYDCGLSNSSSIRLQATSMTTSHEVVSLVLNQIAKITSKSIDYDIPRLDDYCLVSVVGARERRLRENFPPLMLQSPWNKGKLFVRRKDCISAAIQCGNEAAV